MQLEKKSVLEGSQRVKRSKSAIGKSSEILISEVEAVSRAEKKTWVKKFKNDMVGVKNEVTRKMTKSKG